MAGFIQLLPPHGPKSHGTVGTMSYEVTIVARAFQSSASLSGERYQVRTYDDQLSHAPDAGGSRAVRNAVRFGTNEAAVPVRVFAEVRRATTGRIVGRWRRDDLRGMPAATERQVGTGQAVYYGSLFNLESARYLMQRYAGEQGLRPLLTGIPRASTAGLLPPAVRLSCARARPPEQSSADLESILKVRGALDVDASNRPSSLRRKRTRSGLINDPAHSCRRSRPRDHVFGARPIPRERRAASGQVANGRWRC
jgi:Beta-galactosidase trimerisation domain